PSGLTESRVSSSKTSHELVGETASRNPAETQVTPGRQRLCRRRNQTIPWSAMSSRSQTEGNAPSLQRERNLSRSGTSQLPPSSFQESRAFRSRRAAQTPSRSPSMGLAKVGGHRANSSM